MLPIPAKCLLIICRMVAKELQVKIKSNCGPLAALSFPYTGGGGGGDVEWPGIRLGFITSGL